VMLTVNWLCRRQTPARVSRLFRKLQLVSAALYSLGHGGNDAQKTMGIIAGVLVAANLDAQATVHIPLWVVLACHAAMGLVPLHLDSARNGQKTELHDAAEGELGDDDEFPQLQPRSDHGLAESSEVVLVGMADLLDETVNTEAFEESGNLSAVFVG